MQVTMSMAIRRGALQGQVWSLVLALLLGLSACARPNPALDLAPLASADQPTVVALVRQPSGAEATLTTAGIGDPARQTLVSMLIPEILADLTLFGPEASARPRDVRVVVAGDGAADTVVSLRGLPLYRTTADALVTGALPRLAVADRVLEARIAAITSNALDEGRQINGAVLTLVLDGLSQDGQSLNRTGG